MIIMKFGGSSLATEPAFQSAVSLVERAAPRDPLVVVSALGGITDLLVRYCEEPDQRARVAEQIPDRHRMLARQLGIGESLMDVLFDGWRAQVRSDLGLGVLDPQRRDQVLAFGERFAAALLAIALKRRGFDAVAVHAGEAGLLTDSNHGAAHPLPEAYALLRGQLAAQVGASDAGRKSIPVVTGFIGRTPEGHTTTLGRGGSDFSASILGAALGAEVIEIWSDTNGMLTADPRIVPEAHTVPRLSFAEASELAYFGAKILHPKTLLPAIERGIAVRVLNTQQPENPGTLITMQTDRADDTWHIKSISCKKGITTVTVVSTRMLMAHGFLARVFEIFGRNEVVVDCVTTSEVSISLTVDDASRLEAAIDELETIGTVSVQPHRALLAVVGEGAGSRIGLAGHLFTLLGGVHIPVEMISQGASHVNLTCVVEERHVERAVRLLHRGLGLDAPSSEAPASGKSPTPKAERRV